MGPHLRRLRGEIPDDGHLLRDVRGVVSARLSGAFATQDKVLCLLTKIRSHAWRTGDPKM
jgi:hypothetical protein